MRNLGFTAISLVLTATVIANAYYQKQQFYPSVVYITKSNPSMAVIYIQSFIFVILTGKLMRKIFFGELRDAEFEHLMERSWYAMTETCLAFTVFRDDFSPKFVALFTVLLFLKSFHWLAEDRVDFMERSPVISWLFHFRVISLLLVLTALDLNLLEHAYLSTLTAGASVQLVFGFEYAILLTIILNIFIKYILHTIALHSDSPWENKAVYLLYTELIMGFIKVLLYTIFVAIMIRISMLPLFAFRPMYYTMRAFKKAFNDVILSRRAINNMNTLYPDATPEELASADNVCIICREEMVTASKKLPCNHIFHSACLRSWFQRQQTCPTCRLNILRTPAPTQLPRGPAARPQEAPMPAPFPAPFPFAWPNLPQQQPAPQGGNNQGSTRSSTEGRGVPPPPPPNFPFFCPPFTFMPFNIPPPADLSQLTNEQLAEMEENNRAGVEARLQCLRNIQLLLDASVVLMQQYSASAAAAAATAGQTAGGMGFPTPSSQGPSTSSAHIAGSSKVEERNAAVSSIVGETSAAGSSKVEDRSHAAGSSKAENSSSATETKSAAGSPNAAGSSSAQDAISSSTSGAETTSNELHLANLQEARRQRLAKFAEV